MISRQIASSAFSLAMSLVPLVLPGDSAQKEAPPAHIAPNRVVAMSVVEQRRGELPAHPIEVVAGDVVEATH